MRDRAIQIEVSFSLIVITIFVYFAVLSYLYKESEGTKSLEKALLARTKMSKSAHCNFQLSVFQYTWNTFPKMLST